MSDTTQLILLVSLLPVFGFVVGVVCAYFFGKGYGRRKK